MRYIPKLQLGNTIVQQPDSTRTTPRLLYKQPIQQLNTPQDFARAAEQKGTTVTGSLINLGGKPTEKKGSYWDFWGGRLGTNLNQLGNLGMGVAKTVGASAALATGMAYTPAAAGTLGALGKGLLSGAVVDQGYSLLGGRPANIGEIGLGAGATMAMPLIGKSATSLIKKGVKSTGELLNKSVQNAYKLNPYALKENPTITLYRARPIGQTPEMNVAAQLRAKQARGEELKWWQKNLLNPQTDPDIIAREKYHGRWFDSKPSRLSHYLDKGTSNFNDVDNLEILRTTLPKEQASKLNVINFEDANRLSLSPETEFVLPNNLINEAEKFPASEWKNLIKEHDKINKPHWLKGYKKIKIPDNFKSEINWGNWNKEIPSNKSLMDEYLQIEKTAKQNGTWMKNPDGTDFPGTPEQFVQQNSSNFKKAFGNTKVLVNGRPQILTHNSPDTFSEFSLNKVNNGRLSGDGVYTFEEGALWKGIPEHLKKAVRYPAKIDQSKYGKIEYHLYGNSTNPKIGKGQFDDITKDIVIDSPTSTRVIDDINRKNIHVFPNTNQLKSARGNNGMFDMTNSNIYKGIIPAIGTYGLINKKE